MRHTANAGRNDKRNARLLAASVQKLKDAVLHVIVSQTTPAPAAELNRAKVFHSAPWFAPAA